MAKEFTVEEFTKVEEKDVTETGEVDLHSPDAVDKVRNLKGTKVDTGGPPIEDPLIPKEQEYQPSEIPPPPEGMPRVLIVIPMLEVSFKFFENFHRFWTGCLTQIQDKVQVGCHFIYRKPVHIAEMMGVNVAKLNKATHILFMDDDIYETTPQMLEMLLKADKDVIAGVMHASGFPYAQCTFRRFATETTVASQPAQKGMYRLYEVPCRCPHCEAEGKITNFGNNWAADFCPVCRKEIKDLAIQKVDLVPFCFTLIKMSVFDKINKPWFHCNSVFPTDSWFADRCIEAGIQEYAHMLVRLNHRDVTDFTKPYLFQKDLAIQNQKRNMVVVTPEEMQRHEVALRYKMDEAEKRLKYKGSAEFIQIEDEGISKVSEEGKQNDKEKESQCNSSA